MSTEANASSTSPRPRARSRRSRLVRLGAILVGLALLAAAGIYVLTRPTILARVVAWQVGRHLGGDVSIARIDALGNGRYRVQGLTIDAPGWSGPSSRIATIDDLVVTLDPDRLQRLSIDVLEVEVRRAVLSVAERSDDPGAFNIEALAESRRGQLPSRTLPRLLLHDVTCEMGVAGANGSFTESGRTRFAGALLPEDDAPGWFTVVLDETTGPDGPPTPDGIRVRGRFNELSLEHRVHLGRLRLDDRLRGLCPIQVREWWTRLALDGEIEGADTSWTEGTSPRLELTVADTGLTLPVDSGTPWVRLREGRTEPTDGHPRLRVFHGVISLDGNALEFRQLRGNVTGTDTGVTLVGIPFQLDFSMPALPAFNWADRSRWLDETLATAAFTMDFELQEFRAPPVGPGAAIVAPEPGNESVARTERDIAGIVDNARAAGAVALPFAVADIMAAMHMTDWRINIELQVARAEPTRRDDRSLEAAPLTWSGKALVAKASMTYEKFAYPLHDVRAFLTFDDSRVAVESFQGTGPNGGDVLVRGQLAPPGPGAGFDLQVIGRGIPLDHDLIEALPMEPRRAVRALVHASSWERLVRSGRIPREEAPSAADAGEAQPVGELAALRAERLRLLAAEQSGPSGAPGDEPDDEEDDSERRRGRLAEIERRLALADWRLGGTIDLDVSVHREPGHDQHLEERGTIDLAGTTGVFDEFPYPFHVERGHILLAPDVVRIPEPGIELRTAGGGKGRITGEFEFPKIDGRRVLRPDVRIVVADDHVNPLLLAAIPPGKAQLQRFAASDPPRDWPGEALSEAGELLESAGLHGDLSCRASIDAGPANQVAWNVVVSLEDGRAAPTRAIDAMLSEQGLRWPPQLALDRLAATVGIDARRVEIDGVTGLVERAALAGRASIELSENAPGSTFDVTVSGLAMAPWMIDLAPDSSRERLRSLWARYDPTGDVDVRLQGLVAPNEPAEVAMDVAPRRLDARLGGTRVAMEGLGGDIRTNLRTVSLRDLELGLATNGEPNGTLSLHGTIQTAGDGTGAIGGAWTDARFECPMIEEALSAIGLENVRRLARDLDPHGGFDARFEATLLPGMELGAHALTVLPRQVDLTIKGEPLRLAFDQGAEVVARDRRLEMQGCRGTIDTGHFDVAGSLLWSTDPTGELALKLDSSAFTPALRGLLTDDVRAGLDRIELEVTGPVSCDGTIRFEGGGPVAADGGAPDATTRLRFDGRLEVDRAAFKAGLAFDDVRGAVVIAAAGAGAGRPPLFELESELDTMRVAGRRVAEPRGRMQLEPDGTTFRLDSLSGEFFGGMAEVQGRFATAGSREYSLRLAMAGVDLAGLSRAETTNPAIPPEGSPELPAADVVLPSQPGNGAGSGATSAGTVVGRIDARLDVGGVSGDEGSRRGRGAVRIRDARVADMPLTLRLVQLSQLMLPLRASLPMADVRFFILGETLTFEQLELQCDTLRLIGEGTMNIPSMSLSTRFSPRGTLVLVSDLMQPLTGSLFVIDVTGPLGNPQANVVPLPVLEAIVPRTLRHEAASSFSSGDRTELRPLAPERRP